VEVLKTFGANRIVEFPLTVTLPNNCNGVPCLSWIVILIEVGVGFATMIFETYVSVVTISVKVDGMGTSPD
jgi:hypothetical protein